MKKVTAGEKDQKKRRSLYKDDWWLEHLEDELEPNLQEDLELLLKNSKGDRAILESLKRTRQLLKSSDEVPLPESGHFYDSLHDKIMAGVDRTHQANVLGAKTIPAVPARALRMKFAMPSVFGAMGLTMMLALVSWMTMKTVPEVIPTNGTVATADSSFEQSLAIASNSEPSGYQDTVMSFEDESGFIAEVAAERLDRMPASEADEIYKTLRN